MKFNIFNVNYVMTISAFVKTHLGKWVTGSTSQIVSFELSIRTIFNCHISFYIFPLIWVGVRLLISFLYNILN